MNRDEFEVMYVNWHLKDLPFTDAAAHVIGLRDGESYRRDTDDGHLDDAYHWACWGASRAA